MPDRYPPVPDGLGIRRRIPPERTGKDGRMGLVEKISRAVGDQLAHRLAWMRHVGGGRRFDFSP